MEQFTNLKLPKIYQSRENEIIGKIYDVLYTRIGKRNAITGKEIIKILKDDLSIKISGPVFRSIMHYVRTKPILRLVLASGNGYYRASSEKEISDYVKHLEDYETKIRNLRLSLRSQYKQRKREKENRL